VSTVLQEQIIVEEDRTGLHVETLKRAILDNLYLSLGDLPAAALKFWYLKMKMARSEIVASFWKLITQASFNHRRPPPKSVIR